MSTDHPASAAEVRELRQRVDTLEVQMDRIMEAFDRFAADVEHRPADDLAQELPRLLATLSEKVTGRVT